MKNPSFERRLRAMRTYHTNQRGTQFDDGVQVLHRYNEFAADDLSWWDDCQIIVNQRRVMIWWVHPRMTYRDAITDAAWAAAGKAPERSGDWRSDLRGRPIRKKVGKSRSRIVAYEHGAPNAEYAAYYARLRSEEDRLAAEGIDLLVSPSISRCTLDWCSGVDLCLPVEVRNVAELKAMAELGRRLFKGEITVAQLFPGYQYGREQWLAEHEQREERGKFSQQLLSLPLA